MELLVILLNPKQALREIARVTKPGGKICLWGSDCDSAVVDSSDLELTRRILRFVGDYEYNGAIGRQLIGYCRELGFQVHFRADIGIRQGNEFSRTLLYPEWLADAERGGVVTTDQVTRWLDDLQVREAEGRFLAYTPHCRNTAIKPNSLEV